MKTIKAFIDNIFKRSSWTKKTISVKDACIIAKKAFPDRKLMGCYDYGEFYLFRMVPKMIPDNIDINDEKLIEYPIYGLGPTAVRKRNGKVFQLDIFTPIDSKSLKPIPLEDL